MTIFFPSATAIRRAIAVAAITVSTVAMGVPPKPVDIAEQTMGMRADPLLSVDINRTEIVGRVLTKWQTEITVGQRESLKQKLTGLRADRLLAASIVGSFDGVLEILSAQEKIDGARAMTAASDERSKLLGDTNKDLVYTPLAPCRLFDTRNGNASALGQVGGALSAGSTRNIVPAGACSIPTTEVNSLLVSLTTLNNTPDSGGYISLLAPAAAVTTTTDIFNLGSQWSAANSVVRTGVAGQFDVYVATANAHVIVDVLGYFSRPQATALECTTVSSVATNVAAGAYVALPTVFCAATYTPMGLSISAGENVLVADSYTSGNAGQIFVRSLSANAQNVNAKLNCCRIPGR